jgi:hypothetical protein
MIPVRTILCPTDLAEPCDPAFQFACSPARARTDEADPAAVLSRPAPCAIQHGS